MEQPMMTTPLSGRRGFTTTPIGSIEELRDRIDAGSHTVTDIGPFDTAVRKQGEEVTADEISNPTYGS